MVKQTDTLLLNLAFTTTLFLASWFNLNFFSSVYWFLCLLFLYFICTQDSRHIFNNPTIKYMILTIVGYSLIIVLIHISLSVQFSLSKDSSSFNETMQVLGFNKITAEDFNWKNGLSVLFSILNFLIGLIYYHNYVTKSKEIGYQEFIETEITDEDHDKKDYNRVVKRHVLKELSYLNSLAEFCIVAILALNDGIIIAPYMLVFFMFSLAFLFWIRDLTYYNMWRILIWPLGIWTFLLLYVQFFFRISFVMTKLPDSMLMIFGYIFKDQAFSYYGLIPMVLLFIFNCLQRSLLKLINEKNWVLREEDFNFTTIDKKKQVFLEKLWESFKFHFSSFSVRMYQILAILWCMVHPSSLMVLILLCAVCGLFMQKDQFKRIFLVPIQAIGTLYILCQMAFNITYFFDDFAGSQELFLLGIFKYCLFHENALSLKFSAVSEYDMVATRAFRFGFDLLLFTVLTRIYFQNRTPAFLVKPSEFQGTPKRKSPHKTQKSPIFHQEFQLEPPIEEPMIERPIIREEIREIPEEIEENQKLLTPQRPQQLPPQEKSEFFEKSQIREKRVFFEAQRTLLEGDKSSFLEMSYLKPPKTRPLKEKIVRFFKKIFEGLMLHTAKFLLFMLFFASIVTIDGVHFGYFVLFLLFSLLGKRVAEKIWRLQMVYTIIVLILEYVFQVISGYFLSINGENTVLNDYIGVKRYGNPLIWEYKEHLLLLLMLFVQKIVFESENYQKLSEIYTNDKKILRKIDIFSKFFLKYGLLLCYLSLLLVGFLSSPSLLSLCYLVILAIIVIIELMAKSEKKALECLNMVWPVFIVMNFLILTLRYLYQIGFFESFLTKVVHIEETLPLQDIGLDKVRIFRRFFIFCDFF